MECYNNDRIKEFLEMKNMIAEINSYRGWKVKTKKFPMIYMEEMT